MRVSACDALRNSVHWQLESAEMGRCHLNEAKLRDKNLHLREALCCKQAFFLLSDNVHNGKTQCLHSRRLCKYFSLPPNLIDCTLRAPTPPPPHPLLHGSDASFNHYTKSAFMHTTPRSLCSPRTGRHSERIPAILPTADV